AALLDACADLAFGEAVYGNGDGQFAGELAPEALFDVAHRPEDDAARDETGEADLPVAGAEAEAEDGGEPEGGGGGDAEDGVAAADDGAGPDEPHAGEDSLRHAEHVEAGPGGLQGR